MQQDAKIGLYDRLNINLAGCILKLSPDSNWQFNHYCADCARFVYNDRTCKKCGCNSKLSRPLPFCSSLTAIEKLIVWLKSMKYKNELTIIRQKFGEFIESDNDDYKAESIELIIRLLNDKIDTMKLSA